MNDVMDERRSPPSWIRHAVDGAPAVAFLAVLLITRDFALATWFVVGGSALALAVGLIVERRLAPLPAFSGVLALVFVGASLLLHRADILQMKMTIVDGVLGAVLFGGLLMKKNPLKALLGGAMHMWLTVWAIGILVIVPLGLRDIYRAGKENWQDLTVEVEVHE